MSVKILNENNQYELNVGGINQFLCSCSEYEITYCGCDEPDCRLCNLSDCECMRHCRELRKYICPPETIELDEETNYSPYIITKCRFCGTEHLLFAYFGAKFASDWRERKVV